MVVHIFTSVVGLIRLRFDKADIDSNVFKLHYRWTTGFCYFACLLVAAAELIGDTITCLDKKGAVPKPINTYCWIQSTFTINSSVPGEETYYGKNKFHGVGQYDPNIHEKTYHAYYQWVPFILFFQGCLFYIPHLIWKAKEAKLGDALLQGLDENTINDGIDEKKQNIIQYMKDFRGRNRQYSICYLVCEVLNLANVVGQMFILDWFLGGVFLEYGVKVVHFDADDFDPLATTFPRVTMCSFKKYGPTGTIENKEMLCILPQNILNEKVFIFMWFWFVTLATLTAIHLVFLLVQWVSPFVRIWMLEQRGKIVATSKVEQGLRSLPLGDFFLLKTLSHNLDALTFKDVLLGCVDCPGDASTSNGTYRNFPKVDDDDDDDDPILTKKHLEAMIDDTAV